MQRRDFLATAAAALGATPPSANSRPRRAQPLKAGFFGTEYYDEQERRQLLEVLETRQPFRWYGPGARPPRKVADFEAVLARRMKTRHALAVTSGTAALTTALAALQVGPGDEVILPAWTWYSCYNAIVLAGALPVFAEIDESLNLDPEDAARRITPQTKVILAVHSMGNPCDMDRLLKIARSHKIKLLEDCAQSMGADYHGRPLGSLGDLGIYSMHLYKTITAGEGGAVVTNDPLLFERSSRYHDLGLLRPPHQTAIGGARLQAFAGSQYRMNEFTGGVLLAQMGKLDTIVAAVRGHARRIYEGIADLLGLRGIASSKRCTRNNCRQARRSAPSSCPFSPTSRTRQPSTPPGRRSRRSAAKPFVMGRPAVRAAWSCWIARPPLLWTRNTVVRMWTTSWPAFAKHIAARLISVVMEQKVLYCSSGSPLPSSAPFD
jgi:dTDP-4-amino-4,6-dideoxygalactose transaminase